MAKTEIVNWLQLESKIREVLRDYYVKNITAEEAIGLIDDRVGEATQRGFERNAHVFDEIKSRYDRLERGLISDPLFWYEG